MPTKPLIVLCSVCDTPLSRVSCAREGAMRLLPSMLVCTECGRVFELEVVEIAKLNDVRLVGPAGIEKPKKRNKTRGRPRKAAEEPEVEETPEDDEV